MFAGEYRGAPAHPPDLASVLARAWGVGVAKIIVTAGSVAESRAALALARTDGERERERERESEGGGGQV